MRKFFRVIGTLIILGFSMFLLNVEWFNLQLQLFYIWWQKLKLFVRRSNKRGKRQTIGFIIGCILKSPAFFFHELCHVFFLFILNAKWKTKRFYFFRINKRITRLRGWGWSITIDNTTAWWKCLLISLAPILGYTGLWIIEFNTHNLFLFIYLCWGYEVFSLSEEDINTTYKSIYHLFFKKKWDKADEVVTINDPSNQNLK